MPKHIFIIVKILIVFVYYSHGKIPTNTQNDIVIKLQGKIIKENFINKKGTKIEDRYDYFLVTNEKKYYIKLKESDFKENDIKSRLDKQSTYKVIIKEGNWDASSANIDQPVQSRKGEYVIIKDLKTICK